MSSPRSIEERAAEVLAFAPPLTDTQRARLREILREPPTAPVTPKTAAPHIRDRPEILEGARASSKRSRRTTKLAGLIESSVPLDREQAARLITLLLENTAQFEDG